MFKRFITVVLVLVLVLCVSGCAKKEDAAKTEYQLPEYEQKQFEISGGWAPYELNEETLTQYKNAGFNTLSFSNHSLEWTSENQYYLGSERTMKALELCKKLGLNAVISHNSWVAEGIEGEDYLSSTPFSKYDLYGEYKDIIVGVSISDEPKKEHIPAIADKTFIEDFKKVYPNAHYGVNLIPITANASGWGYTTYEEMISIFEESFMEPFDRPYISFDIYPFHKHVPDTHTYLATNYELIAKSAKKYNAKYGCYIQSSVGNEFESELSEGDLRWQVNTALSYGVDSLVYYLYSVPLDPNRESGYMYDHCILNPDNTPSPLYGYVQKIHKEIQSYASVILSYDWDTSYGVLGEEVWDLRVGAQSMNEEIFNSKHFVEAHATRDLLINRFTSDKYGEAYMLVNFADNVTNKAEVTFKECKAVAIYGEIGFDGTPRIVELKDGKLSIELEYGEAAFITPIS